MLSNILQSKNYELVFQTGSILENININDSNACDTDIDELGSSYGKSVVNFLNIVRNEIIPAMSTTENMLASAIADKDFDSKKTFDIVKLGLPSLFSNLKEHGGLNVVGNGMLPVASVTLPIPKKEEIRNWFITDSEDINYDISDILENTSDDELIDLWEKYLYSFSGDNILLKDMNLFHYSKVKELSLLYAVVRNLTTRDPGEVSNLMGFRSSVVNIFDFVKVIISKYIDLIDVSNANTKLVHSVRLIKDISTIYVFEQGYNSFLENSVYGVDSIIGYAITKLASDNAIMSCNVETIAGNEESFYKAYNRNIDMLKLKQNRARIEGHLLTYRVYGPTIYRDVISKQSSTIEEATFLEIYRILLVKTEEENDELDVELFVKNLFSMIYPRVKRFLNITSQMDSDSIDSGLSLSPNEVILYATLELITSELMDQVTVREVPTYKV